MRHLSISAVVVASACLLAPAAAQAADLPIGGPRPLAVDEFVSNWYLRGDVGYQFSASSGTSNPPFTGSSYSDAGVIDFGIGYRAGWLRADVTSSWVFEPHFTGSTAAANPDVTARVNAISTLFNVYVDLGNWYGLTPYVGGGAGFSWLRPTGFNAVTLPVVGAISRDTIDFSWDLTAGFSYAVTRQFLIDTSYRFLHVGTPRTDIAGFGTIDYGSMDVHELKTGIRYLID
jgi:opacity protein-like surface antigen